MAEARRIRWGRGRVKQFLEEFRPLFTENHRIRIVSLFPAATELVCQLGLDRQLVGVSHECDWPESVRALPKVTTSCVPPAATSREIDGLVRQQLQSSSSLYALDRPLLDELRPDLIVSQSLCGVCAVAESDVRAAASTLPTQPLIVNLSPTHLSDVYDSLRQIGAAAGCVERAESEIADLQVRVDAVGERSARIDLIARPRVVLLEWIDPPFTSGHWTPELVRLAGGREMIGAEGQRSRSVPWNEVIAAQPDVLIIACCGFDIARTLDDLPILRGYPGWNELPCVTSKRVYVFDGSAYFNRPGPRLVDALEILAHTLHPEVHPLPPDQSAPRRVA
ncbi:MAG: cobalamin-binding protein [Pirellulales bacterium]